MVKTNLSMKLVAGLGILLWAGCQTTRPNTMSGGLFGTAAGGLLGAAIGAGDGKAEEGALIGALAGGATGSLLGNQADQRNDAADRRYNAQQQELIASAVTLDQVVNMSRSGLTEDLIITQVNANGVLTRPNTNDLIQLKNLGVSDRVIQSLQNARLSSEFDSMKYVDNRPNVIVQERMPPNVIIAEPGYTPIGCDPPVFVRPFPVHGPPRFHHRGRRSHVGFSIDL